VFFTGNFVACLLVKNTNRGEGNRLFDYTRSPRGGRLRLEGGVTGAAKAEMFATHIENMLRAENQIPLRTHYGINNSSGSPVYEGPLVYPGTRASTNPQFNQYVPFLDEWLPYVYQN